MLVLQQPQSFDKTNIRNIIKTLEALRNIAKERGDIIRYKSFQEKLKKIKEFYEIT
jgi:uncharacterized protein YecE (DUF72 family)